MAEQLPPTSPPIRHFAFRTAREHTLGAAGIQANDVQGEIIGGDAAYFRTGKRGPTLVIGRLYLDRETLLQILLEMERLPGSEG